MVNEATDGTDILVRTQSECLFEAISVLLLSAAAYMISTMVMNDFENPRI